MRSRVLAGYVFSWLVWLAVLLWLASTMGCTHPALRSPYRVQLARQADGSFERVVPPWTRPERLAVAASVACSSLDVGTTVYAREGRGMREMNPLVENYAMLAGSKLAIAGMAWWLGEYLGVRSTTWLAAGTPQCAAGFWNVSQLAD